MTKFEEELFNKVPCKFELTTEAEYKKSTLINHFKDWHSDEEFQDLKSQLQQQAMPVVPECVAEIVELLKKNPETPWSKLCGSLGEEGVNWLNEFQHKDERFGIGELNNKLFVLFHLAINGYQVEKPQLFYIELPKIYGLSDSVFVSKIENRKILEFTNTKGYGLKLTEQEIKSIDERYWQFAVPVEDNQ